MIFDFKVQGAREVDLKFDEFPRQAHGRLVERMNGIVERLAERVRAAEPFRTGKLRGETVSSVRDEPERIVGRVRIDAEFAKAGALEYGAHRATNVRSHSARLDHIFGRLVAPLTVTVSAHLRQLNIAEHAFLRRPLAAMADDIVDELRQAVDEAAQEAST